MSTGSEREEPWIKMVFAVRKRREELGREKRKSQANVLKSVAFGMRPARTDGDDTYAECAKRKTVGGSRILTPSSVGQTQQGTRLIVIRTRIRAPKSTAILIRCNESGLFYVEIVSLASNKIDFVEIGIMDIRRAQMGGNLVKVSGDRSGSKPDELLRRLIVH